MLGKCISSTPPTLFRISVRGIGGSFSPHDFDHAPPKFEPIRPVKPTITIPVPVQQRALRRHRSLKKLARDMDREKLKDKPLIISTKRKELNHKLSQTYGKFSTLPLVSSGWYHRKSFGDHFTIYPFKQMEATGYMKDKKKIGFNNYDLEPELVTALGTCGFSTPTNIQHEAIPQMLQHMEHHHLIAAETGNGKTLAFLIPVINQILRCKAFEEEGEVLKNAPLALIITPGRELADQIGVVARGLCQQLGLKVIVAKGGQDKHPRGPLDILIGSFGGIQTLFERNFYKKARLSRVVIDEIDTMIDDTFKDMLLDFMKNCDVSGQNLTGFGITMAGATFPTNFDNYLGDILDPEDVLKVSTNSIHMMLYHVRQKFIRVPPSKKTDYLMEIIKDIDLSKSKVLIFSNKIPSAVFVEKYLQEQGIECVGFHGGEDHIVRRQNLDKFITGQVNVVSCTDLMSRGLDTNTVTHIINFDFPRNPADYIHRVGRIGRMGGVRNGQIFSLVSDAGGAKVLENLETAVRKNVEIKHVNNNIIRIIKHRASKKSM